MGPHNYTCNNIAVITFFVKIFGKIIVDYMPYCDDRKYAVEITGISFFLMKVVYPSLFSYVTYHLIKQYFNLSALKILPLIITVIISILY